MTEESPNATSAASALPPRVVVWAALAVCVAGTVLVLLGAWRVGISTDEPAHVIRYENLQEHGWYLLDDDLVGDEPGAWVTDQYVYAPVFTQVLHAVNRALGLDPSGALGTSVDAYAVRHLVVGVCGLVGMLAVAGIGRRLFGSWSWGLVSAATLMAIPMWPGLSMFDLKDIPPATGYTLVTWGLVEMLGRQPVDRRKALGNVALLVAGLLLAVGTRPGLWPGLAMSLGLAGLLTFLQRPGASGSRRRYLPAVQILLACVLAYAVLWMAYPACFTGPEWVMGSVFGSADYSGNASTETSTGTWTYVPERVVATMPPGLLLIGVVGCATLLPRRGRQVTPQMRAALLVVVQALLLPLLAIVRQSHLYDDLRQLLFACPAVALLLTMGWRKFVAVLGQSSQLARTVLALVWSAALLIPVGVQVQLFPYAYAYASPLADRLGAFTLDDYWRVSYRELLPQIPRGEFIVCYPYLSPNGESMRMLPPVGRPDAERGADCRTHPISTIVPFHLADGDAERYVVKDSFLALFNRGLEPGSNCEVLGTVSRTRYLERALMSQVARCDLVLSPLPEAGVELRPDGTGAEFLLGGWTSHLAREGVQLREPTGSLGFELPEGWQSHDLRIRLEGRSAGVPEILVNDEPVRAAVEAGGWVVDVPAATVGAMGGRRLVVTLTPSTRVEDFVLTGVSAEPRLSQPAPPGEPCRWPLAGCSA